jgi:hypothetical protein
MYRNTGSTSSTSSTIRTRRTSSIGSTSSTSSITSTISGDCQEVSSIRNPYELFWLLEMMVNIPAF